MRFVTFISHIIIYCCDTMNIATFLPLSEEGELHNCMTSVRELYVTHSDLLEIPMENPDLILFVDGSILP